LSDHNIYVEHLDRKGEGLHHLGMFVSSLDPAVAEAERPVFSLLQSGRGYGKSGDGGYADFDTEASLGVILELIEIPRKRIPPEMVYPPRSLRASATAPPTTRGGCARHRPAHRPRAYPSTTSDLH
jgi:methylmalonyl-CoA/ethylmalonyl-CoA epimerase